MIQLQSEITLLCNSDVLMVLFKEVNGKLEFVAGDDDSGTELNAKLSVMMSQSQKYVLRIQMTYKRGRGETAVMFW